MQRVKYHYPNRFKSLLNNPENKTRYRAYRAVKTDDEQVFLKKLNEFRDSVEDQRLLVKDISKRRNDVKTEIRNLARMRKEDHTDKESSRIENDILFLEKELKMIEKEMIRLSRKILDDLEKKFEPVKAMSDIYMAFPKETRSEIESALRVNTLPPSNVFYWVVELAMKVDSMIKQYEMLKNKRKFRGPANDRPDKYLGNQDVVDHFLDVFALFNNVEKSFFIRFPQDAGEIVTHMSKFRGQLDQLVARYEILGEDYPEVISAMPKGLQNDYYKIGTNYPLATFPEPNKAKAILQEWFDFAEEVLKDIADFAEVYIRIKSLYPFTIGMRSVDRRGRDVEYMKYVDSLNTLLDDALSRKSISLTKRELLFKAYDFYPHSAKFKLAVSMHQ